MAKVNNAKNKLHISKPKSKNYFNLSKIVCLSLIALSSLFVYLLSNRRGNPELVKLIYLVSFGINGVQIVYVLYRWLFELSGRYNKKGRSIEKLLAYAWIGVLFANIVIASVLFEAIRLDLALIFLCQVLSMVLLIKISSKIDFKVNKSFSEKDLDQRNPTFDKKRNFSKLFRYVVIVTLVVFIELATLLVLPKWPQKIDDIFNENRVLQFTRISGDANYADGYYVEGVYIGTSTTIVIPKEYNNTPVLGILEGAINDSKITSIQFGEYNAEGVLESNLQVIEKNAVKFENITEITIPSSVKNIEESAFVSKSLKTVNFEANARLSLGSFEAELLETINIKNDNVITIDFSDANAENLNINVEKDLYNDYRQLFYDNRNYFKVEDQQNKYLIIDFETDCNKYIESKIVELASNVYTLTLNDLKNQGEQTNSLIKDTLLYNENEHAFEGFESNDGYVFRGWYSDPSFVEEYELSNSQGVILSNDITIYAKWVKVKTLVLDWGAYRPYDQQYTELLYIDTQYDEDNRKVPALISENGEVEERLGFNKLSWIYDNGTEQKVIKSTKELFGIEEDNITVKAVWDLNTPNISYKTIENFNGDSKELNSSGNKFMFDENRNIVLSINAKHISPEVSLSYKIYKEGTSKEYLNVPNNNVDFGQTFHNVNESGNYTIEVLAAAKTGETALFTTTYNVEIEKKILDIDSYLPNHEKVVYNGESQKIPFEKESMIPSDVTYSILYEYNGTKNEAGPKDVSAQAYLVTFVFEKMGPEKDNYAVYEHDTTLRILPKEVDVQWEQSDPKFNSNFEVTYNGEEHSLVPTVIGVCGEDTVNFTYNQLDKKINIGTYTTIINGVDNPNYILLESAEETHWTHTFDIVPMKLISTWSHNATNVPTYDGNNQEYTLKINGLIGSDLEKVETSDFTYSGITNPQISNDGSTLTINFTFKDAGNYQVSIEDFTFENYQFNTMETEIVINKARLRGEFSENYDKYDGLVKTKYLTISGFKGDDNKLFDLESDFDISYGDLSVKLDTTGKNAKISFDATYANDYIIKLNAITNNNYYIEEAISTTFTISTVALNGVWDTTKVTYNGYDQVFTYTIPGLFKDDADNVTIEDFIINSDLEIVGVETSNTKGVNNNLKDLMIKVKAKDTGTYDFNLSDLYDVTNFPGNGSYVLVRPITQTFEIKKLLVELNWSESTLTYNSNAQEVTPTITNICANDVVAVTNVTGNIQTAAGRYTAKVLEVSNPNYYVDETSKLDWVINNKTITVSNEEKEEVYDGKYHYITIVYSGFETSDLALLNASKFTYNLNSTKLMEFDSYVVDEVNNKVTVKYKFIDVDTYQVKLTQYNIPNYDIEVEALYTSTITPKELVFSWDYTNEYTYNGISQGVTPTITNLSVRDDSGLIDVCNVSMLEAGNAINVGNYTAKVLEVDNANYYINNSASSTIDWKIVPKKLTYVFSENELTYNGYNQNITLLISGYVNNEENNAINKLNIDNRYNGDNSFTYSQNANNASEYLITFSARNADEYEIFVSNIDDNYQLEDMSTNFVIKQKVLEITWEDKEFIYNGKTQYNNPSATNVCGDDIVEFVLHISQNGEVLLDNTDNAGDYTNTIINCTNKNYKLPTENLTNDYTIKQRVLTISSENNGQVLTYNGNVRSMTIKVDGFQTLEDSNNFKSNTLFGYTTNTTAGIQLSNNNLYYSYVNITFGATNASDELYSFVINTIKDSNYTIDAEYQHTFSINKRVLNISWNGASVEYNGETQYVTPLYENICGSDVINATYSSSGTSYLGGLIGETANFARDAGEYTVTLTAIDNSNYTIEGSLNLTTTFNISKKLLTVEFNNPTLVYNGDYQGVIATHSDVFASDAALFKSNPFTFTANNQKVVYTSNSKSISFSGVNNGTYDVQISGLIDECANYTINGVINKQYNIAKRTIEVSWSVDKLVYNGTEQEIAPTITNLCNNVLNNGMQDSVQMSISGNKYTNSGSYNAQISSITEVNNNYLLSSPINKTWEINKQELSTVVEMSDVTFDGKYHYLTVKISGFNTQEDLDTIAVYNLSSYLPAEISKDYENKEITLTCKAIDFGTYRFNSSNVLFDDYYINGEVYSFEIYKASIELEWGYETATYNGQTQVVSCIVNPSTIFDREDGAVEDVTLEVLNNQYVNAGSYTATAKFINTSNYNITNSTYGWAINKAPLTVSFSGETEFGYDATDKVVKVMISGFQGEESGLVNNFNMTYTSGLQVAKVDSLENGLTVFNLSAVNANTYEFNLNSIKSGYLLNYYLVESSSKSFVINPAKLTYEWSQVNAEAVYTGVDQNVVLTISGFKGSDVNSVNLYANMYGATAPTLTKTTDAIYTYKVRNVGDYLFELKNFDDRYPNYVLDDLQTTYKVNPKELTVNWSYEEESMYNGVNQMVVLTINGFVNGEEASLNKNILSLDYNMSNGNITNTSYNSSSYTLEFGYKNVGTYTTALKGISNDNYVLVDGYKDNITMEIKSAPLTIEFVGSGNVYTYNGENQGITVSISGFKGSDVALYNYFDIEHNVTFTNYAYTDNVLSYTLIGQNASDYAVKINGIKDGYLTNYHLFSEASASFKIERKQLVANWNISNNQYVTYDGLTHNIILTVEGFANNSDAVKAPYNASYFINTLDQSKNYVNATVSTNSTTAIYTYSVKDAGTYTCYLCSFDEILNNYTLSSNELTYTIQPKELTVSWDVPKNVVYDGGQKYVTLSVNGFVNYEGTILDWRLLGIEYPTSILQKYGNQWDMTYKYVNAGEYQLAIDKEATTFTNYVLKTGSILTATLFIEKATYDMSGVSFNNQEYVYDATNKSLTISGTLPNGVTVIYSSNTLKDVGSLEVTASFTGNENYYPINDMTATLTITPSPLTIEWDYNAETVYDGTAKPISFKLNGFKGNDGNVLDSSSFNVDYTVQNSVKAATYWSYTIEYTIPGIYVIELKRANATFTNYEIVDDAVLTATMTIEKGTYDMSGVSFVNATFEYDGLTHVLTVSGDLPEGVSVSYSNNGAKDAGKMVTVMALFTGSEYYNPIEPMFATLKITTKELAGQFNKEDSYTYNGTNQTITYVLNDSNNLIDMSQITVTVSSGCTYQVDDANNIITFNATEVGTYNISIEYNDGNCYINEVEEVFVINAADANL